MDELVKYIIEKYNLPRPISKKEAIGKTIKEISFGTWIKENTYIIFTDNTIISLREDWYGDSHDDYVLSPKDYDEDYITDMGYNNDLGYHDAYNEFRKLKQEENIRFREEREKKEFERLKEKFDR